MKDKYLDNILKGILFFIALTLIIPCLAQTPVDVRKTVGVPVSNSVGTVLAVREQRDITTNAIAGGSVGVTGAVTITGQSGITGTVTTTGQHGITGTVSVSGITTYPQVGVTGNVAITAASLPLPTGAATSAFQQNQTNNEALMIALLQNMTNYAAPYTLSMFWNPGASISSNIFSASACTIGPITVFNTNNVAVQFSLYNAASGTTLGSTNNLIWSGPVPAGFTNSAGYAINLGGYRCSSGLIGVVTGGGNTNAAPAGPIWVNGAFKP